MPPPRTLVRARPRPAPPDSTAPNGPVVRAPWLLLIHQLPPKPDYLRVKVGRHLQRIGAVAIKNSVYVLPQRAESYEDLQWLVREIEASGGEAFISESVLGDGLTDDNVRDLFHRARDEDYTAILADAKNVMKAHRARRGSARSAPAAKPLELGHDLARLRKRFESVVAIDFLGAPGQRAVAAQLEQMQERLNGGGQQPNGPRPPAAIDGATWVTRRNVHVDRIASAWLIRRFIDRHARFRFVDPTSYEHQREELRFDMFEGEYTHVGDACTFEVLTKKFLTGDSALVHLAEIVHDVDCKDGKFARDEAPGLARVITGIAASHPDDPARIERGGALLDDLYAAFGAQAGPTAARRRPQSQATRP